MELYSGIWIPKFPSVEAPTLGKGMSTYEEDLCDDSWSDVDARVACRMLGYSDGRATKESRFGIVPGGDYGMDEVQCQGYEISLTDCDHETSDDCSESEAAGVICGEG